MLELKQVSHWLDGAPLLSSVSLTVVSGKPTAIVGLSPVARAGMARLVSGADRPQSGQVLLEGQDVARVRAGKGRIARVSGFGLAPSGQKVERLANRGVSALAGISTPAARLSGLSPLQRVKLALAHAASGNPRLLLIDAPASQLTFEARGELAAAIPSLIAPSQGVIVVLAATADEALAAGGDVVVVQSGVIVQAGSAAEVCGRPVNLASAMATCWPQLNVLPMHVEAGHGRLNDGSRLQLPDGVPAPPQAACTLAFRPDDVTFERAGPACLRFIASVVRPEGRHLAVTFSDSTWLCPPLTPPPHPGALISAFVDRSRLMLFDAAGKALR